MKKKNITTLNVGDSSVLKPNTSLIRFEGSNTDFFWRIYGDVINPDVKIVVPPTHQAIYIKDGILQDILEAGSHNVFQTVNKGFLGIGKKVDSTVVDIIFMNKTIKFNALWGTHNPILLRDTLTEIPVTLRGNGEFEVGIDNPKKFYLEIVGADKRFDLESLQKRLHVKMMSYIEPVIAKVMHEKIFSYIDIPMYKKDIAESILPEVNEMFIKDCGLKVLSFTIDFLGIEDEEITAIENELAERKREIKEKRNSKELAEEIERYDDKSWERSLVLKKLEMADRDKYYEVLKIIGNKKDVLGTNGSSFCPNCGHSYENGMKFCVGCGMRLPGGKTCCPNCGQELDGSAKFCFSCGHKM